MKITKILTVAALAAFTFAGCASAPAPAPAGTPPAAAPAARRPDILDHQGYAFGQEVPFWVTMEAIDLEKMDQFKDKYVFKFDNEGQSREGAEIVARNFGALQSIAQQVNTRVQAKFAGAQVGDNNAVETYFENVVKALADAQFSGARQEGRWWVLIRRYNPDGSAKPDVYNVILLYTMDKRVLDEQIRMALQRAGQTAPQSEEEQTARARVREIFNDGI